MISVAVVEGCMPRGLIQLRGKRMEPKEAKESLGSESGNKEIV